MISRELELRELYLEVSRNRKSANFPVLHASIGYRVGTFPTVQVTISSAAIFSGTNNGDDIKELFEDSPEGSKGTLWLKIGKKGNSGTIIPLFTGYISGTGSNLVTSILSVQSNISFQLVCQAAAMNANPGGAYTYFTADTDMDPQPYKYHIQSRLADVEEGEDLAKLEGLFATNPAESVVRLIDLLRTSTSDSRTGLLSGITALSSFSTEDIRFKFEVQTVMVHYVLSRFGNKISGNLIGSPTAGVVAATLNELLLSVVPQTLGLTSGDSTEVCKLIVRPLVSGWSPNPKITLEAGDVLGISDTTSYRLDQRVDFWYVQVGKGPVFQSMPLAAVYAPGYGEKGNAVFLDMDELSKAITNTLGTDGKKRYLVGRGVVLPWWLYELVTVYSGSDATLGRTSGEWTNNSDSPGDDSYVADDIVAAADEVHSEYEEEDTLSSDEESSNDPDSPGDEDLIAAESEENAEENAAGNPTEAAKVLKLSLSTVTSVVSAVSRTKKPSTETSAITVVTGGGTNIGKVIDKERSKDNWEEICKRLAVLSFLENGCAVNSVALKLPLYTAFRLLPWLGDTIAFNIPSPQQTTKENELYKITTTPRYGLLDGISIMFECSHREIQVTCGATLSQVHDETLHKTMSAANPIYEEAEDKCYNLPAKTFIENFLESDGYVSDFLPPFEDYLKDIDPDNYLPGWNKDYLKDVKIWQ